ncbi:brother of CDO-like [Acanthaster planci]|uniref:Brother of CDO-like n=1 Tax=Acanthaster planci TaxID=133434 RepID=A0A8B7ZSH3_ACAPL|nr:brother of CDO-like [Acanthaster planci]XP_022108508.1 brother of CDO-like [Acanthaster planci]XP_022108509.1 brother of CDO-like [Acanthaster planci]XP_022108510.1 brother of CDO-like [Acanthaster planci]XP_022108512.1 brother of CDO-like [Acanthaster planci]XP_022108513.1 brother of CDO-like [Acanthaster planci]XP_022108514.1 brother of CDO-like [Acanthaster planci]XP_022108515.1 brother of CDO-like [Acanthaster planci]XP_022108516.1 brother of CDO-like [Acanthaster planci]XP_02210851
MEVPICLLLDLLLCSLAVLLCQSLADSSPSFLREPRSRIVKHDIRVKLRCKVDPKDAPIWWSLDGQDITDPASLGMEVTRNYLKINSFQGEGERSHNGDYQCKAGNQSGMIVSRVAHIQAAYLRRFPSHLPMTTYAKKGSIAVIACPAPDSVPSAVMSYEFKGQPISGSSDHYRIMPSGHLHIINVSESDEGHYTCLATNPALSKTHTSGNGTTLVLQDMSETQIPPTIQASRGMSAIINEKAVLECVPNGVPFPEVRWEKVDGTISSNAIQHTGSLEISPVSRSDAGAYRCTAFNGQKQSQGSEVILEVIEPVSISKAPKNTHVDLGGTGHFKCTVRGAKQNQIVWLFNGERIPEMSLRHEILDGQLIINGVMRSDLGPYQCFVHTQHGSAQATAKLMLREGFPDIVDPPVNTTAIEGENVFLSCGITGDPMPFVNWYDPVGTVVRNTRSTFISEESGGLTIYRVGPDDVGWYRCTASNKHGQVAAEAYLAVIEKISTTPVPESSSRHVLNPPVNDDITITTQTTDEPNKPGTVPEAPTKPIIIKTSDTSVQTRWDYLSRIPVTSFTIQYRDVTSIDGWVTASNVIPRNRRVYEVQGLKEGATYRFRVIASNSHGDSEPSEMSNRFLMHVPGSMDPPVSSPPDPPRIINCIAMSSTSILVEWEFEPEFPDIPVTGFYVHYRNTDSDDDNDYTRTPVVGRDVRRYQIRNLEAELTYDIKMQTFNDGGASQFSNVVIRGTMAQETPPPPIIIPDPFPSNQPSGGRNPNIPSLPDDNEPDTSSGQGQDILYITLGVVVGAMLLVLIMFAVMCIWRTKQVNNDRVTRDFHHGYYCDGAYRHANGNAYKFGHYMNGNTPQGHGIGNPPFGETVTPGDPRPLYTMPQDTLDEVNYFPGLSPPTSPVANGHIPVTNPTLQPCHLTNPNENSNHSSGASNEHLYVNGSCRSLRGVGGTSDREGQQVSLTFGVPGSYGTGERPVCPSRHPKGEYSRGRKRDGVSSREATDSELGSDVPSSFKNSFPSAATQSATAPDLEKGQQGQSAEGSETLVGQGSHDSLNQLQGISSCRNVTHSDI